jgi:putative ABC transport system permease protein
MLLLGIAGAVTFTILLVSANTMAMSVRERVREVGVLKTLGFTPGIILTLILGEAAAISLMGGAAGYLISVGLTGGISRSPYGGMLPPIDSFAPSVAVACMLTAGVIGVASSLVPALGASRISIVNALRSED